ncbi:MAG: RNB domain-containing ribonuclease, partial [Buchnera aphidicola]|nr:RNB domain-containing ribonuclease [Buchnera aphidicola]MDE5285416.1 RNB domain-containing ribonuclease [Buchnera aphidicola]
HSIPYIWSLDAQKQILDINKNNHIFNMENRIDLRNLPFFTIDDEDACDFDDAVFCKRKIKIEEGWDLWVAISDVSHYITPNSALDKAALERGNSIYFPSFVIPMLPEKISTDVCSLKPYVERLCLVCQMSLSNTGMLLNYKHYEAIICSKGRFTYNEIFKLWNGDVQLRLNNKKLLHAIDNLHALQKTLDQHKELKKNIYFENIEPKFILNSKLRISKIYHHIRNDAHKFIESCMILANIASASFIEKYKFSSLFRNHDKPSINNIISLRLIL